MGGGVTPSYVYVSGAGTGVLSAYSIHQGNVTPVAAPAVPAGAVAVAATPNAKLLFVATADGKIVPGSIAAEGSWQAASAAATSDAGISALLTDPAGQHLFAVAKNPASLQMFSIAGNGTLTPSGTSVPLASGSASDLAISPDGRLLFLALGSAGVRVVRVNANPAQMTPVFQVAPTSTRAADTSLAVSGNGQMLYVAESGVGIRGFKVRTDGSLAEISGSPFAGPTGSPTSLAAAPGALYVAYGASGIIAGYSADARSGRLTPVAQAKAPVDSSPESLSVLESGATLVATSSGSSHQEIAFNLSAAQPGNLNTASVAAR